MFPSFCHITAGVANSMMACNTIRNIVKPVVDYIGNFTLITAHTADVWVITAGIMRIGALLAAV